MSNKSGRLSLNEEAFIKKNHERLSMEEICEKLGRGEKPVLNYLRKIGKINRGFKDAKFQTEYELRDRPFWKELQTQFSPEELELFLFHWTQIIGQFKKDVLPTEELQIVDVIRLEILMNRHLAESQLSAIKIDELEAILDKMKKKKEKSPMDREDIFDLERQIATLRIARQTSTKDYNDTQSKKSALFKDIKGTRDQRVAKIESTKETFDRLMVKIASDPIFCEEQSIYMEKMKLAIEEERKRLGDYHTFADGSVDQVLLNHETVLDEP